jgi:hypothetical protein
LKKRLLPYLVVAFVSAALTTIFQPLAQLPTLAQGGCQTFSETGKTVCGRFLQYWQQHGALAQQGYPITNAFVETSDLDSMPYTVQYFERSIFESHPEKAAPFDILLSQLGTFRLQAKYYGLDPSVGAVTPPNVPPAQSAVQPPAPTWAPAQPPAPAVVNTAAGVVEALKSAGLPVAETVVYTADTDPNKLLGRQNQYTGKASWHDNRLPGPKDPASIDVSEGGSVELFTDTAGAKRRFDYVQAIGKSLPYLAEYDYLNGTALLRISNSLTPDQVSPYQRAFNALTIRH